MPLTMKNCATCSAPFTPSYQTIKFCSDACRTERALARRKTENARASRKKWQEKNIEKARAYRRKWAERNAAENRERALKHSIAQCPQP